MLALGTQAKNNKSGKSGIAIATEDAMGVQSPSKEEIYIAEQRLAGFKEGMKGAVEEEKRLGTTAGESFARAAATAAEASSGMIAGAYGTKGAFANNIVNSQVGRGDLSGIPLDKKSINAIKTAVSSGVRAYGSPILPGGSFSPIYGYQSYAEQDSQLMAQKGSGVMQYDKPIGPQMPKKGLLSKLKMPKISSGGVGGALMMGSMAAGMLPGDAGAQAQSIMGPLMSVGMAFMMLPAPIAAVVSALGLVAFGVIKFNQDLSQAAQDGRDLSKAMSMTNDKLIAMSTVTQTVSATELRKAKVQSEITGITQPKNGKQSFGTQYLTTDAGTQMLNDIQTQLKNGSTWSAISSTLANQFSVAIQEGILTDAQAKSIAEGLGAKLKNYKLSVDIQANLVGLTSGSISQNAANTQEASNKTVKLLQQRAADAAYATTVAGGANPHTGKVGGGLSQIQATTAMAVGTTATVQQIQQNQQLLDSINQQYDAQIKTAKATALSAKGTKDEKKAQQAVVDLENQKTKAVKDQNLRNAKTIADGIKLNKEWKKVEKLHNSMIQ
jgi:hypothetical protein